MASSRRIGSENAESRDRLLDAAERLMLEHGYASVTSRRVAAEAGLKPQLVHYYFRTMDDLFIALFRRRAEQSRAAHAEALASDRPLRTLWEFSSNPVGTALTMEFVALANHRKAIEGVIASYADEFRKAEAKILDRVLAEAGVDTEAVPPAVVSLLMVAVSRVLVLEEALGLTTGHDEARALVEQLVDGLEPHERS